jgi:hypothetical protein
MVKRHLPKVLIVAFILFIIYGFITYQASEDLYEAAKERSVADDSLKIAESRVLK